MNCVRQLLLERLERQLEADFEAIVEAVTANYAYAPSSDDAILMDELRERGSRTSIDLAGLHHGQSQCRGRGQVSHLAPKLCPLPAQAYRHVDRPRPPKVQRSLRAPGRRAHP